MTLHQAVHQQPVAEPHLDDRLRVIRPVLPLGALLLWSRTDRMMPFAHAVAMSSALPGGRLVAFDDGGSLLQLDEPLRVAAEINAVALA